MFVTVKVIDEFPIQNHSKKFWVNRCQIRQNLLRIVQSNQLDILKGFEYDCETKKIE